LIPGRSVTESGLVAGSRYQRPPGWVGSRRVESSGHRFKDLQIGSDRSERVSGERVKDLQFGSGRVESGRQVTRSKTLRRVGSDQVTELKTSGMGRVGSSGNQVKTSRSGRATDSAHCLTQTQLTDLHSDSYTVLRLID